ncbi:MAG: class I SAM-dependent methyltransferase [Bacilli bacterium]|nr:class I SAM-dependent methyltransferase [Bacilli bacterium]
MGLMHMAHYFTNEEIKSEIKEINILFQDKKYKMFTDNGVFSKKGLDYGTRALLEKIPYQELKGDILDFGCGYGPIGIIVSSLTNLEVDMIDVNFRSMKLAKKNALANNVKVNIFESNIYENITKKYDYIITNPPIRVGKEILYKILFGAKEHLKPNGELYFVINKDQGAKSVTRDLEKIFLVSIIDKNKGFYIIKCQNK